MESTKRKKGSVDGGQTLDLLLDVEQAPCLIAAEDGELVESAYFDTNQLDSHIRE